MTKMENVEKVTTRSYYPDSKYLSLPNHAPREIFSRKFLVREGVLSVGGSMFMQPFAEIYSDNPTILNLMDYHKYFRCDSVELDISITAPVSMGGYLFAWWTPGVATEYGEGANASRTRFFHRAVDHRYWLSETCAVLSTADSESVQMELKWNWPSYVLANSTTPLATNLEPSLSSKLQALGRFHMRFVAASQVDQASPQISYRVFGRYVNPYLGGPRIRDEGTRFELQSGEAPIGLMAGVLGTVSSLKMTYDNVGGAEGIEKTIKAAKANFETLKPYAESVYCSIVDCEETEEKKDTGFSDQDGSHISVRQNVWGDTSKCSPDSTMLKLGTGKYEIAPTELTGSNDEIDVYSLCQRWCFQDEFSYSMSNRTAVGYNVDPTSSEYGWMRYFNLFFRLWRGSIKYKYKCYGSPLITYQVSVSVNFDDNIRADTNHITTFGNVFTKQVTVRGTTEFDVEVPYMRESPWCRSDLGGSPRINFSAFQIGSVSGSNNNVDLPVLVLVAAGQDFRFRSLRSAGARKPSEPIVLPLPTPVPSLDVQKQGLIDHTASETDLGRAMPYVPYAWTGTLRDIITRPSKRDNSAWKTLPGQLFLNNNQSPGSALRLMDNFDHIATLFLFYSGSINIKAQFGTETTATDLSCFLADIGGEAASAQEFNVWSGGNGVYRTDTEVWDFLEIQVPFVSPWPMYPLGSEIGLLANNGYNTINTFDNDLAMIEMSGTTSPIPRGDYFISAGQDFALHCIQPPWNSIIMPNRDTYRKRMVPRPTRSPRMSSKNKGKRPDPEDVIDIEDTIDPVFSQREELASIIANADPDLLSSVLGL